jgi:hypothetical protein
MTTEKGFRMSPTVILTDTARELDAREADGLEITLVWYQAENALAVRVFDTRTGERHEIPVDAADAREAFEHPFAYAVEREELFELPLAA